ncbi:MAG: cytochrome-c peroxidase [Bacteroidota bacterium]
MGKLSDIRFPILVIVASMIVFGCGDKDRETPQAPGPISFQIPAGFPSPVYDFNNNEVNRKRFELGRKLFYDPLLSRDNTISCGSCHQQEGAFAHIDHRVSHGIDNLNGTRNSPALFNLAWHNSFFWDGGVNHIEVQPISPIQNPVEMDETLANVVQKLQNSSTYRSLFLDAYGSDSITSQMMLKAMSQFMALLVSADSKYDKYIRGESGGSLTAQELNGLNLFRQKCASCHVEPLFTDLTFRNNGLDSVFVDDPGRAMITQSPSDSGKFKVPSLRNIELSFPYMHNGSLNTLDKVLNHYASGVKNSPTLDPLLNGGMQLSTQEKADIISFLRTLTDHKFVTNKEFADPN